MGKNVHGSIFIGKCKTKQHGGVGEIETQIVIAVNW